jgi:DNA-binding CsgD family transcriptional regulator
MSDYRVPRLTPRERELLRLCARGATNEQIGEALGIKRMSVQSLFANVRFKMQARNRYHATALAVAAGLVTVDDIIVGDRPRDV